MSVDREILSEEERSRLIKESTELVFDFADSELRHSMPKDVTYVLIPDDNSALAATNRTTAEKAIIKGNNVLMISASKGENPGGHYTRFSLPPSSESLEHAA